MFKKLSIIVCAIGLMLSITGCDSNNDANSTNSSTTSTIKFDTLDPTEKFEQYNVKNVATIGNTKINIEGSVNFTPNNEEKTMTTVCVGSNIVTENEYDATDLKFYIFKSEEEAKVAFDYIKTHIVRSDSEIVDNYIIGKDKDAVGIVIKHFYYINRNMIVYHLDYMSDPGSTAEESEQSIAANKLLHEDIMKRWNK